MHTTLAHKSYLIALLLLLLSDRRPADLGVYHQRLPKGRCGKKIEIYGVSVGAHLCAPL